MRDYLYLWIDKKARRLESSGIEFKDCCISLGPRRGLLLLRPQGEAGIYDRAAGFDVASSSILQNVASADAYRWGDFAWVDFEGAWPGALSQRDVAALLFLAHRGRPLGGTRFRALRNRFLAAGADDGWHLALHFTSQRVLRDLLTPLIARLRPPQPLARILSTLETGRSALWLTDGRIETVGRTTDIDKVLNFRLGVPPKGGNHREHRKSREAVESDPGRPGLEAPARDQRRGGPPRVR